MGWCLHPDNISEEARGKKKKKKREILHKLKLLAIGAIIAAKLCLLLKLAQTALLLKLVLIGLGIFAVNVAKLIALWKAAKQKTIYYENSHHDHHYDHDHDDIWGHDDHWDREADAQNLAYANQKISVKSSETRKKSQREGLVEKIVRLVKKILFLVTAAGLLTFLLKYLKYALDVKRFMLEVAYFVLKAVKCWAMIKYAKHDTTVEFQHVPVGPEEHHYIDEETHDDDHHHHDYHHDHHGIHGHKDHHSHHVQEHGGWGWSRSGTAQSLAYRRQAPQENGWSIF
nr:unnamed protein product [Callosobruchus analis]